MVHSRALFVVFTVIVLLENAAVKSFQVSFSSPRRTSCRLRQGEDNPPLSSSLPTVVSTSTKRKRPSKKQVGEKKSKQPSRTSSDDFQSHRRFNQLITQCQDARELLQLLQSAPGALTKFAGGNALNSVNFSTSLHRLARHSLSERSARASVLSDPRFALLISSVAEALSEDSSLQFGSREVSNIGWALTKLKLAPPATAMPVQDSVTDETLLAAAKEVRKGVLQVAAQRRAGESPTASLSSQPTWIPALSRLTGHILDRIGHTFQSDVVLSKRFQLQEASNLLWAWATAGRANPTVFRTVIKSMIERQKELLQQDSRGETLRPQEWSNSLWSFATAQIYEYHEDLIEFVSELMTDYPSFVSAFKTQELSNTVWGVATLLSNNVSPSTEREERAALVILRIVADSLIKRAAEFRTQELSNSLWSFATLGFGLTPSFDLALNNYFVLRSDQPQMDHVLVEDVINSVVQAAMKILPRFRSQELNNLAWSIARLVDEQTDLIRAVFEGIGVQLCDQRRRVTSQDIGTTLWSFATLGFFDDDLYKGIVSRLTLNMAPKSMPTTISNTLWGLATAEMGNTARDAFDTSLVPATMRSEVRDPVTFAFGIGAQELMRRPHQFKPQEIKDILWSFSKAGIRHPSLFKTVAQHLVGSDESDAKNARGLAEFTPQGLSNMLWSYARQAQLAEEVPDRIKGAGLSFGSGRVAVYTASYFDIGEVLIQRLFSAAAEADLNIHNQLRKLKPQDLCNSAYAFAVLGLCHSGFVEAAKNELMRRTRHFVEGEGPQAMTFFKGQELANLLWSLATLNVPSTELLGSLVPYMRKICQDNVGRVSPTGIARIFKRQELANIAWSCAVFGAYPRELMEVLYAGIVGVGDQQGPSFMAKMHNDDGLQSQIITSLIYVQAGMDLDGSCDGLALPDDFPEGWRQSVPAMHEDHTTETDFERLNLNLSTSKVQLAVSAAFNRIGFEHVSEHVILMEEMANEHGISLPALPLEILSIDIANLQEKIAVEVDGPAHFISRIDEVSEVGGHGKIINGKLEYQFNWNGDRQYINGPTALKQRILSSLGWTVINLPFWEWYALGGDEAAEEDYCRSLLAKSAEE